MVRTGQSLTSSAFCVFRQHHGTHEPHRPDILRWRTMRSGHRDTERILPKCAGISMIEGRTTVAIIDSDDSSRERLRVLFESAGLTVEPLASAEAYLEMNRTRRPNCIVLDVQLPGRSGLDLQAQLAKSAWQVPLVFITAHNDVRTSVQAMKAGAIEYLTKPFRDQEALDAVRIGV